jgi:hypothetical protein
MLERAAAALRAHRPAEAEQLAAEILKASRTDGAAISILAHRHALGLNPDDALTRAELATCLLEMSQRDAGEAALRRAVQGRPQLLGRAAHALAVSSHGRFFFRPSALQKFLQRDSG